MACVLSPDAHGFVTKPTSRRHRACVGCVSVDLHTYGKTFRTSWVTIHDTAIDGNAPFEDVLRQDVHVGARDGA